jgi:hypothetical protein
MKTSFIHDEDVLNGHQFQIKKTQAFTEPFVVLTTLFSTSEEMSFTPQCSNPWL